MFPRNTRYAAATAAEVADKPLGRTNCNQRRVFCRGAAGQVVALEDLIHIV